MGQEEKEQKWRSRWIFILCLVLALLDEQMPGNREVDIIRHSGKCCLRISVFPAL